jgi:hypothetical protein
MLPVDDERVTVKEFNDGDEVDALQFLKDYNAVMNQVQLSQSQEQVNTAKKRIEKVLEEQDKQKNNSDI